ncbi:hypothetical protein QYE76_037129 [Lolium multiflorum]|uniref:Uncharacterized protein n=1 Tax=Lolium multiflorum TaxID=4521 RepID=A0AAD8R366_LOLMU|nr:hypothetical protein QYE76_037129 [Lolium multiflorum]
MPHGKAPIAHGKDSPHGKALCRAEAHGNGCGRTATTFAARQRKPRTAKKGIRAGRAPPFLSSTQNGSSSTFLFSTPAHPTAAAGLAPRRADSPPLPSPRTPPVLPRSSLRLPPPSSSAAARTCCPPLPPRPELLLLRPSARRPPPPPPVLLLLLLSPSARRPRCFEVDTRGGIAGVIDLLRRLSITLRGYFEVDRNGDGQKRQTTVAKNILRYLPVLPRIQRLFMTEDTAQQMRWAVEGNRYTDKMIHPSDGTAWKNFVKKFPLKAGDPRSVAVAISSDGFNPYGRGIRTYDASKKEYFDMYVWYHTSLHDLPARALFCGWCTHGKWPCPQCRQAVTFFWLNKGGKYSCFDEARQFLERRHAYRSDVKSFKKGRVVRGPKPIPKTGTEIKAELDALQPSPDGNGFLGYGETHQWTHKPCLWKLPYFEFLELPHNIDVMHTEKNISEAIWSTIVDTEKTKDNIKARIDQERNPTKRLHGWDVVMTVPSRNRPPPPNKDDYRRVDPSARSVEFYREEGLPGHFTIGLPTIDDMVVDDEQEDAGMDGDNAEDEAEDVCAPEDLSLLEAFKAGIDLDADGPPPADDDEEEDQEHHGGGEDQEEEVGGEDQEEEGGGEDQEEEGDEDDLSEDEGLGNLVFDPDPSLEWCEPEDYQYVPALERLRPRDRKPYRRGITQLPSLKSWRYRHVVLVPYGRSSFQFEDPTQRPPRGYSNILGGLLRFYFPGIVDLPTGGCDVAWRWAHYSLAEDPLGRGTAADLVVAKFWKFFKRAEGKENACDDVLHQLARKRVTGMHYEARVQCVRDWHADRFVHMSKEDARDTLMQPWQYLQNPPQYVGNDDRCFRAMVMWWTCPQYLKKHEEGKKKRAEMRGGSHIQGSIPISLHLQKEEVRTGAKPNVFAVLKKMKQRKTPDPETGSVWVNPQSETQCTSYVSKFKQKYGEEANPEAEDFDPEVAVLAGEGLKHGRLWFGDGCVDPAKVPSLRQIRRGRKSGQPEVEPRPRASDLAVERLREEMAAKEQAAQEHARTWSGRFWSTSSSRHR